VEPQPAGCTAIVIHIDDQFTKGCTALEMDYGMEDGTLRFACRRAMRIYALRRLGFVKQRLAPPMLNELKQLEWIATED